MCVCMCVCVCVCMCVCTCVCMCVRVCARVTTAQQRMGHIGSVQVSQWFGREESLEDLLSARRLHRLGHLARMEDDRLPKFGWLPERCPAHGTKGQSSKRYPHQRR